MAMRLPKPILSGLGVLWITVEVVFAIGFIFFLLDEGGVLP